MTHRFLWHHAIIIAVAALVLFTNLGAAPLWDRDEPRNAGCAWEMLMRGDWVVPIFNDELRDAKPVLLYWLIMGAYGLFGVNEFAARFPSAVLAIGTVIATYHIGRRLFNEQVALWASVILSTSLMFDVAGRAATPDSVLIFCSTAALAVFVLGTFKSGKDQPTLRESEHLFPTSWLVVVSMYGIMGLGILAKGPVGLVLPTAVIGMFLLIMRLAGRNDGDSQTRQETVSKLELIVAAFARTRFFSVLVRTLASAATLLKTSQWPSWIGLVFVVMAGLAVSTVWHLKGLLAFALILAIGLSLSGRTGWLRIFRLFAPMHFLRTCLFMRPVTAIVTALAVAAPWFILVGLRTEGDYLQGFFLKEHFGRATTAMENHDGPPYFYLVAILLGFFPWSVFAVPVLIDLVRRLRRSDPWTIGYVFAACWIGVYVGIFTLATTKLPSYITPCYPALALLTGCFMHHWTRGKMFVSSVVPKWSVATLAAAGAAILVGLMVVTELFLPGERWVCCLGIILIVGAIAAFCFIWIGNLPRAGISFAIIAVAFTVTAFGFVTVGVGRHQENHILFNEIAQRSDDPQIGSFLCLESTWVFCARQPIYELRQSTKDGPSAFDARGEKNWRRKPNPSIRQFFKGDKDAYVITTDQHFDLLKPLLPGDVQVIARAKYFLKDETLILLGRENSPRTARRMETADSDRWH